MPSPAETALLLSPLLWAVVFGVLALAAGGGLAARLTEGERATAEWLAFALALGVGLLAQALFVCGVTGRFGAAAMALVAAVALRVGWRELANTKQGIAVFVALPARRRRALVTFAVIACVGPACLALYPPLAWDDTIYHLPLARSLIEHGRYVFVMNLRAPVFPLLGETLFAPALLLGSASTAHGVSLAATLATALLLFAWGRDFRRDAPASAQSPAWELAPLAIWIGQPIVVLYAGSTFIEPLLTLFVTAAALAFERWRRGRAPAWLLVAGACAGWAAATKYLGLYLVAALALAVAREAGSGLRMGALARFAAAATLAAGPWYALIWVLAGNPLFPFFSSLFGGSAWSGIDVLVGSSIDGGGWRSAVDVLRLGWDLVVDRARWSSQPPASPVVIVALPLLLFAAWRQRRARLWVAILGGYLLVLLALPHDARYLTCYSPLLCILLVSALRELAALALAAVPRRRSAATALVVLALASGPAYAAWRIWRTGPPPASAAATDGFLVRRLPLYRALLFRREHGLDRVPLYALHAERLHDFGGSALLGDWFGPYRYALVLPLLDRPDALADRLRDLGAEQLLLPRALVAPRVVEGITASPRFRVLFRDDAAVLFAL